MRRFIPLLILAVCLTADLRAAEVQLQTLANVMVEHTFEAKNTHDDPFNKVSLDVVFTDPNGKTLRAPTFWAGSGKWKVRYASPVVGTHKFLSECSDTKTLACKA